VNNLTDQQLLRDYMGRRSEEAFTELVRRHVDFVYSAALRMVRDAHLAEDVTQAVFVALARNARQLADRPVLSGWLHRTTQNLAANAVRSDVRRRAREQEAAAMNELHEPDALWEHIAPHLDAALSELSDSDRDALLLRYFERKSAREMAQTLGISDEAAQKRVSRAVERMREFFAKRRIAVGASGLAVVISANAVQAAPAGLAAAISTATALAGTSIATAATATATKAIVMTTFQKVLVTAAIAVLAGAGIYEARQASQLREQNKSVRQQMAGLQTENENLSERIALTRRSLVPRLPAPAIQTTAPSAAPPENLQSTNLLARVAEKPLQLTAAQAENFLAENHRNASSLLAAFRTTGNAAYLDEALRKFPDNPQVAFEAALKKDASPQEKRRWLDALKKSAPDNPLANYLAALEYFNSGQADHAVEELIAAAGKSRFNDYYPDRLQANEEAYRSAGYSEVETRVATSMGPGGLAQPQLRAFRDLSVKMVDLANSYRQAGDETSAQAVLQMAVNLGENFDGSKGPANRPPLTRASGLAIEARALSAMDPASPFGTDGGTVKDRLDHIASEKAAIVELVKQLDILYPKATPQDMINFLDRARLFGDEPAMDWLKQKYGEK